MTDLLLFILLKYDPAGQTAGALFRIGQRELAAVLTQKHYVAGDDGGAAEEEIGLGVCAAAGVIGEAEGVAADGLAAA